MAINAKSIKYKDTSSYKELLDIVWPIGSTYFTTSDISPSQTLGGTWVEKKDGMVATCGTDTYGYSGRGNGELQGHVCIATKHMPSHNHTASASNQSANHYHTVANELLVWEDNVPTSKGMIRWEYGNTNGWASNRMLGPNNNQYRAITTGNENANHTHTITVNPTGGGRALFPTLILFIVECELPKGGEA